MSTLKSYSDSAAESFLTKYQNAPLYNAEYKNVTKAKGWYSGFVGAELTTAAGGASSFSSFQLPNYNDAFAALFLPVRSVPYPNATTCTAGLTGTPACQKVLAKLK